MAMNVLLTPRDRIHMRTALISRRYERDRNPLLAGAILALAILLAGGSASAKPVRFLGPHPVAAQLGGGYCYIEGPHLHGYAPDHAALYAHVGGALVFAADPTPFGYDGPRFTFYGHHPLTAGDAEVYCYLDGPHAHPFEPEGERYRMERGVAFYVGPFSTVYERERRVRAPQYRRVYAPWEAQRPTVTVTPPPEWRGEVYVPPPPSVTVNVPPPPSVVVDVPAPPRVGVQVIAPPPPRVGVQVIAPPPPAPRPVIVVPAPIPIIREEHDHDWHDHDWHDHGKHKGWWKHGHGGRR